MANAAKHKGDRAEREAVEYLVAQVPDLVHPRAEWRDDVGDLRVFDYAAVQVRNYKLDYLGAALRSSATDAVAQARNGRVPGLGPGFSG
ncbi:hypothetical protein GCG21_15605 [Pseudactinotalea sp. HY160]|uniref:hypothetical protein n=1 Tax=Pseudactinotalea sp. HY160 TaxID=2654490 RepID=UPI00128C6917|nr:hypothetical protein [Pseudactinotalea sp. HY160]MPV51410.1 hypothetical protein [Pseudactinotalea sp. HY160]